MIQSCSNCLRIFENAKKRQFIDLDPWSILTDEDNSKLLQIAKLRLFLNLTIHHGKLV